MEAKKPEENPAQKTGDGRMQNSGSHKNEDQRSQHRSPAIEGWRIMEARRMENNANQKRNHHKTTQMEVFPSFQVSLFFEELWYHRTMQITQRIGKSRVGNIVEILKVFSLIFSKIYSSRGIILPPSNL